MSTPQAVAPPGPSASGKTSSSQDWLANLILIAKTITAATELTPIPYIKGAIGPVVPILEAIEKMGKNRDAFKDLCESIMVIVKMFEQNVSQHQAALSRLEQLCKDFEMLLHEIQGKLGENQKDQHKKVSRFWKGFTRSTTIGNELARYKDRVNEMRLNFIFQGLFSGTPRQWQ
ncbi:hypothetical protein B0H19DRAFT_1077798 [Mycena capillaripes]|nr:hypothetical protein B0H19DRAFT_1077798 [Mycena capillaripes]